MCVASLGYIEDSKEGNRGRVGEGKRERVKGQKLFTPLRTF